MKFSFWDILATLVMLMGLAMAIIFINILINPYSAFNPFPPPTPIASLPATTLTLTQQSLPELWTATPETPGVPSATSEFPLIPPTSTRLVLPTRTANPNVFKTFTKTPNWALTAYSVYLTAIKTSTPNSDITSPTTPGNPTTASPTTDPTPTWYWTASTDSGSGLDYYLVTWGVNIDCNNALYSTTTNSWTSPALSANTTYYVCVRARDKTGNETNWVGPSGFYYSGGVVTSTFTQTSTRTQTPTITRTSTSTGTSTLTPTLTLTNILIPTSTSTATATQTLTPVSTSTNTLTPTGTSTSTATETSTVTLASTETSTVTSTQTPAATSTVTNTVTPTETGTITLTATATMTMTPTPVSYTISGNTGVGPTITPTGPSMAVVAITVTGDPGAVVTQPDGLGNYTIVVPPNWSGEITPARIGHKFTPIKYTYANVNANISGQNFTSVETATFTISGNVGAAPGTTIIVDNGAVVTVQPELDGNYVVVVYSGWTGSIKPKHATCTYTPPQHDFTNVTGNMADQNFVPACP